MLKKIVLGFVLTCSASVALAQEQKMGGVINAVIQPEPPGDLTVVFTLKQPFGPFLGIFEVGSLPMVPKHLYDGTDFKTNPYNNAPVGTGPFMFKEWQKGSFVRLVKNPNYHVKGKPYIDEIYWQV